MAQWSQHILVLLIVLGCGAFVVRQGLLALRGRKSKLGGCGSCGGCATQQPAKPETKPAERIVFLPADLLGRRK